MGEGMTVQRWEAQVRGRPVIVQPGAENLHESPLAPNMMDRWSHIDNPCSLVSWSHVRPPIGWEMCACSLLFMGGIQRWWGGVGGKPLAQFAWERLQMRVEMRVCHIAQWDTFDKLASITNYGLIQNSKQKLISCEASARRPSHLYCFRSTL